MGNHGARRGTRPKGRSARAEVVHNQPAESADPSAYHRKHQSFCHLSLIVVGRAVPSLPNAACASLMVCSNMTRPHQLLLILFLLTLLSRVTFTSDVIRTLSGDYPVKPLTLAYHRQPVRPRGNRTAGRR